MSVHPGYEGLDVYYGDIHSHCDVGYGYGTAQEAYENARLQLDFASVTAHAHWPDMPADDPLLAEVVAFHQDGFRRARELWPQLQEITEAVNVEDTFVSLLSCEWHSMRHGDHNVYWKSGRGDVIRAADLEGMRAELRRLAARGEECFLIPHHIGYRPGYRGIQWQEFSPEFTPVVEMVSMHGLAESSDAPYPYLHATGPRDGRSTMHHGLQAGKVFGVIGATDHHSAHPGSYGRGRMAAWATDLSRQGIWEALKARRTYALTGDRIALAFSLNGQPMGSVLSWTPERAIDVSVVGGGALDYVEVMHNNRAIHRWSAHQAAVPEAHGRHKLTLEVGWGKRDVEMDWRIDLHVARGMLLAVEPRFRGPDLITPYQAESPDGRRVLGRCERLSEDRVRIESRTWGNPNTMTPATQGACLEILGDDLTTISGSINGRPVEITLGELKEGARVEYLGGYRSHAFAFQRAVPAAEYAARTSTVHRAGRQGRDWYYLRVCQKNGQWAWSSPIWVGDEGCGDHAR